MSSRFPTRVLETRDWNLSLDDPEYRHLTEEADLLFLLAPYHRVERPSGKPVVTLALGSLMKGGHWLAEYARNYSTGDTVIVNSTSCQEIYDRLMSPHRMRCVKIPFGIDLKCFRPRTSRAAVRRDLRIPLAATVLLYAGRLSLQKNTHALLSLLREVRRQVEARLVVVGRFDNFYIPEFARTVPPDSESVFRRMVAEMGLEAFVTILPHRHRIDDVAELMSAADLGVNMSTFGNENFGLAQLEMQACGLPVVCSDWAGMRDTVSHGITGYRVATSLSGRGPRFCFPEAVKSILRLLQDRELRRRMSRRAVVHARNFSLDRYRENIAFVVTETAASPRRRSERCNARADPWLVTQLASSPQSTTPLVWRCLDPLRSPGLYRSVLTPCATIPCHRVRLEPLETVFKGFDWNVDGKGEVRSLDPRWSPELELAGVELDVVEKTLLAAVDAGVHRVGDLERLGRPDEVRRRLRALLRKGFLVGTVASARDRAEAAERRALRV